MFFGVMILLLLLIYKHAIKHLIIKPFDLLNPIPLTTTKTLVTTC